MLITATSFTVGIGITQVPAFFDYMPQLVRDIFQNNMVTGVFVVALLLSILLLEDMERRSPV